MEEYKIVGKIDRDKLGKYRNMITTDEVILTYERIEHIEEKYLNDLKQFEESIKEVLYNPDYILEDIKNLDTIIILKELIKNGKKVKMIIKLATNIKEKRYNSIITLWNIRKRDYNKTVEKMKIIYKNIDKKE